MEPETTPDPRLEETLILLKKLWVAFLVGLYMAGLYNEYIFPSSPDGGEPGKGEMIWLNIQRVVFFGLLGLGFLTDLVQIRIDGKKAFLFLFASLILGGLSNLITMGQMKLLRLFLE